MNFVALSRQASHLKLLVGQNSSVILTGVGVVGTVGTAVLTGRSTFKAADVINNEKSVLKMAGEISEEPSHSEYTLSKTNAVKLVWPLYIPPITLGVITVAAIVVAHRIDAKKIMALTVASGISERALREYKEKIEAKLGDREAGRIRDEIAQDRVTKNPPLGSELVLAGDGKVLCVDQLTGRYFMSSNEDLRRAENMINRELIQYGHGSLSMFFDEIGLAPTAYTDEVGWSDNQMLDLQLSSVISVDNRPCLAVDYSPHPFPNYNKFERS